VELNLKAQARLFLGWQAADPRWPKLEHYLTRVREAGVPLVSHRDRARLVERHLIPSLEALPLVGESGCLMDVGSGGGFPAIPLAFARPSLKVVCIEANSRKAAFLRRVSRETGLNNVEVIESRAEDLDIRFEHAAEFITSRAVADLPEILVLSSRFLAAHGCWLFWKGQDWKREADLDLFGVLLIEERALSDGSRLVVLGPRETGNPP
jgi:16S rRNA (guanine(527)-N(7))-methyltransferase RsmG